MLVGSDGIKEAREHKLIIIDPFDEDQLGSNSYDVRLGNWYWFPNTGFIGAFDPTSERDVKDYWNGPYDLAKQGHVIVPAHQTILAHTQEYVGGFERYTSSMRARSSIGRCGLSVCKCAGLGDVGFVSRWTMEISNHTATDIMLPIGIRIAQMEFFYVGPNTKRYTGKYGIGEWSPEDMLPKLYKDRDLPYANNRSG